MASTAIRSWSSVPDIIADGTSDQEDVMTAICETKGATFDGTDCVGELNDATVEVRALPSFRPRIWDRQSKRRSTYSLLEFSARKIKQGGQDVLHKL